MDAESDHAVITVGNRRELFVDDFLVEQVSGSARFAMGRPIPRERVITLDQPWEGTSSGYFSLVRDDDRYRMYYRGSTFAVEGDKLTITSTAAHPHCLCYAESDDGIHWRKPELGLIEFEGSRANNILMMGAGHAGLKFNIGTFSVFRDSNPAAPASARYKALFRCPRPFGLLAFGSPDGIQWTPLSNKPVITHGAFDSQNLAFWDASRGHYRAYWRYDTAGVTTEDEWTPEGWRAIRTAVSTDFIHWTDEADLAYGDDALEEHLYTNAVQPCPGAPHILIGFPMRYVERPWSGSLEALPDLKARRMRSADTARYGEALTETLFMCSRDGVNFRRRREGFLRPGIERSGTWNYGHNAVAWPLVLTRSDLPGAPDELTFYAAENYWTGPGGSALRRHTLRRDGFVALKADQPGGELITKPLQFAGERLRINFATSVAGAVRVELQDAAGVAIPGFALDDCEPLFGDTLNREVVWQQGAEVGALAGQTVRLRFALTDAECFAFQFGPA